MTKSRIYATLMSFWMDMEPEDVLFETVANVLADMIKEEWFVTDSTG